MENPFGYQTVWRLVPLLPHTRQRAEKMIMTFDQLFERARLCAVELGNLRDNLAECEYKIRTKLWQLSADWWTLQSQHKDDFVRLVRSSGKSLSQLQEEWFRPAIIFGWHWAALVTAISKGMQVEDYNAGVSPETFLARQSAKRSPTRRDYNDLVEELRKTVRTLKSKIRKLQQENAALRSQNEAFHRALGKTLRRMSQHKRSAASA